MNLPASAPLLDHEEERIRSPWPRWIFAILAWPVAGVGVYVLYGLASGHGCGAAIGGLAGILLIAPLIYRASSYPAPLRAGLRAMARGRRDEARRLLEDNALLALRDQHGEIAHRALWRLERQDDHLLRAVEWVLAYLVRFPLGTAVEEARQLLRRVLREGQPLSPMCFTIALTADEAAAARQVLLGEEKSLQAGRTHGRFPSWQS